MRATQLSFIKIMLNKLKAKCIIKDFRTGSSLPALAKTSNNEEYVVKWKGTGEGIIACLTDMITMALARTAGITVPENCVISVDSSLDVGNADIELKELIQRSIGINLCVRFIPDSTVYTNHDFNKLSIKDKNRIFLFDLLMLNIDRIESNPNMLIKNNKLHCIDFASAMEIRTLIQGTKYSEDIFLPFLKRHPFYNDNIVIADDIFNFQEFDKDLIKNLPEEWLAEFSNNTEALRNCIYDGIKWLKENSLEILSKRISLLKKIIPVTTEDLRKNSLKNRDTFLAENINDYNS
jgi:hypothetical protein